MPTDAEMLAAGGNDVGSWGDKDISGAYDGPLNIAGEQVDLAKLPKFGSDGSKPARAPVKRE